MYIISLFAMISNNFLVYNRPFLYTSSPCAFQNESSEMEMRWELHEK